MCALPVEANNRCNGTTRVLLVSADSEVSSTVSQFLQDSSTIIGILCSSTPVSSPEEGIASAATEKFDLVMAGAGTDTKSLASLRLPLYVLQPGSSFHYRPQKGEIAIRFPFVHSETFPILIRHANLFLSQRVPSEQYLAQLRESWKEGGQGASRRKPVILGPDWKPSGEMKSQNENLCEMKDLLRRVSVTHRELTGVRGDS